MLLIIVLFLAINWKLLFLYAYGQYSVRKIMQYNGNCIGGVVEEKLWCFPAKHCSWLIRYFWVGKWFIGKSEIWGVVGFDCTGLDNWLTSKIVSLWSWLVRKSWVRIVCKSWNWQQKKLDFAWVKSTQMFRWCQTELVFLL